MTSRVAIPLDLAIEYQGKTYDEIVVTEPTYGQQIDAADRQPARDGDMWLISQVSGIPMQALRKAPASKMNAAVKALARFLEPAPASESGETE